jgi:hypothetical protein
MISGFLFNLYGVFFNKKLLNHFYFRLIHLAGIILVITLELLGKYCPLTLLENYFNKRASQDLAYQGSFTDSHHNPVYLYFLSAGKAVIEVPGAIDSR